MPAVTRAVASATDTAAWQGADSISAADGGAGQVATPRWPGSIPADEHAPPGDAAGPFGTAPSSSVENPYAAGLPWLDHASPGLSQPVQPEGTGLPGRAAPNSVPLHDGYGGTAQVMARHGQDDGSAAQFARSARGGAMIPRLMNLLTRRMPTDWRKEYDAQGQLVSYEFDRPSLQIQQLYDKDTTIHTVEYEAAPIYRRLAQVAKQQSHIDGIYAPDGQTPDRTPYQNNDGNPVYSAPPDPQTSAPSAAPADAGYSFGDLYA